MTTKDLVVQIPVGRKALIVNMNNMNTVRYDAKGNWLGYEVIEVNPTFSGAEAKILKQYQGCPECGGIGEHNSYFVRTGQDGLGTVDGYTKQCSRGGK